MKIFLFSVHSIHYGYFDCRQTDGKSRETISKPNTQTINNLSNKKWIDVCNTYYTLCILYTTYSNEIGIFPKSNKNQMQIKQYKINIKIIKYTIGDFSFWKATVKSIDRKQIIIKSMINTICLCYLSLDFNQQIFGYCYTIDYCNFML